jgi:hypothetical protein
MTVEHIERLRPRHLPQIARLFGMVFGHAPPLAYFQRKYDVAYLDSDMLGFGAFDAAGQLVATFIGLPCRAVSGDDTGLIIQGVEAMTRPDQRQRGWFARLGAAVCQLAQTLGIRAFFAFANAHSARAIAQHPALELAHLHTLSRFTLTVYTWPLETLCQRAPMLRRTFQRWATRRLQALEKAEDRARLFSSPLAEGFGGLARDAEFFRYRAFTQSVIARVAGQRVWLKANGGLWIGDVEASDPATFAAVVAGLRRLAAHLGIRQIIFQVSPDLQLHHWLQTLAPAAPSWPVFGRSFQPAFTFEPFRLTWGDFDNF